MWVSPVRGIFPAQEGAGLYLLDFEAEKAEYPHFGEFVYIQNWENYISIWGGLFPPDSGKIREFTE